MSVDSFNVHQAKSQLSRLLERVEQGEEIVIARNGHPVARLVPVARQPRQPGRLKGQIVIPDNFDDPLPDDILTSFSGEDS